HTIHALTDGLSQLLPFPLPRLHETVQRLLQRRQGLVLQCRGIGGLGTQHARVLQQIGETDLQQREARLQALRQLAELLDQRLVDRQRGGRLRRAQAHHQVQLAATDPRGHALAQQRFQCPQVFRQAHADFKEAVVDRAQLASQGAPRRYPLTAGVGGHAPNHVFSDVLQRANGTLARPGHRRLHAFRRLSKLLQSGLSMTFSRPSGRQADQLRTVTIERGFTLHAEGSVLVSFGGTRVLCTTSIENRVPGFLRGKGEGWVTAEYGMLPRSTHTRSDREAARGKQGGRTLEIQRLIGRTLRACIDRNALGERTITLDCDVLQADGGTRTAAITGAYVALVDAVNVLLKRGDIKRNPIFGAVAAVSVGVYKGEPVLDLDYAEDSDCDTDMNVVMNDGGGFIELQGTAEGHAFRRDELDALLALAEK